jgi:cytochrome bd ubiquinol oxidase subunit II
LQDWSRRAGQFCLVGTTVAIVAVSIWAPLRDPSVAQRWFSWPNIGWLAPVPLLTAALVIAAWLALRARSEFLPFLCGTGLFLLSYIGIVISLWPMIVPFHFTIWQAASSESTQAFLLIGMLFLLPIILGYTAWSYWVFRGKIRGEVGYH